MASNSYLTNIDVESLDASQMKWYQEINELCSELFGNTFASKDGKQNLIGPFGIYLHNESIGRPFMEMASHLGTLGLPPKVREVAILTTGSRYKAEYELYAHAAVAEKQGLSKGVIERLVKGEEPGELGDEERIGFEVAKFLTTEMGPLPKELWGKAKDKFGEKAAFALVNYVGYYAWTCVILNGFNARVPEEVQKS